MNTPFLRMTYHYDNFSQLTGIDVNGEPEIAYTLNKDNQRTAAEIGGSTRWQYSYDELSQLTGAVRKDSNDAELNNMSYSYDMIGNRLESEEDGSGKSYTTNLLNQYSSIESIGSIESITYDPNGNMLTNRGWTYTWNTENRLIKAEKDELRLEFDYDYRGRRAYKKVYGNEVLTTHQNFIYDDFKLVAICDALNNNIQTHTFFWQPESVGLDVPLCMILGEDTYFYVTDGNKNVIGLFDETGTRVATYTYGPFGQILSMEGILAEANPFRFSSEFHDNETDLAYYNYRYYDPIISRWTRKDPVSTHHGSAIHVEGKYLINKNAVINAYLFIRNKINTWDILGLQEEGNKEKKKKIDWEYPKDQPHSQVSSNDINCLGYVLGVDKHVQPNPRNNSSIKATIADYGFSCTQTTSKCIPDKCQLAFILIFYALDDPSTKDPFNDPWSYKIIKDEFDRDMFANAFHAIKIFSDGSAKDVLNSHNKASSNARPGKTNPENWAYIKPHRYCCKKKL